MARDISSFVERYQLLYEKDPDSKVFAPLAEAYRRMSLVNEAIDLAEKGVVKHPNFASGRVTLGKCYAQNGNDEKACEQLKLAVELSPENLMAHQILGDCYLRLKRPSFALESYKMVLFLNPNDERVAQLVKDLEVKIFADDKDETEIFSEEEYSMKKLAPVLINGDSLWEAEAPEGLGGAAAVGEKSAPPAHTSPSDTRRVERELALLNARFERGEWAEAQSLLDSLLEEFPDHEELREKRRYINELSQSTYNAGEWLEPIVQPQKQLKKEKLEKFLKQIQSRKRRVS